MQDVISKLDEWGQPAWLGVMVISFILFWPVGLGVLAFLLWSGRMGCGWNRSGRGQWQPRSGSGDKSSMWSGPGSESGFGTRSSGNHAFDEYRVETLKRLEEEQREFRQFLDKLRWAKDRSEFDQFMTDRKNRPAGAAPDAGTQSQNQ